MEEFYTQADIIFQDCECTGVNFYLNENDKYYVNEDNELVPSWPKDDMEAVDLLANGIEPQYWKCFKFGSGVHANYAQLAGYESANSVKLSPAIKAKMFLSHYQDFVLHNKDMYGNPVDWKEQSKKEGFAGFVKVGDVFEV